MSDQAKIPEGKQEKASEMFSAIHDSEAHRQMLSRIEDLWGFEPGTSEHDELEVLSILIDNYENKQFPIEAPGPVQAVGRYGST